VVAGMSEEVAEHPSQVLKAESYREIADFIDDTEGMLKPQAIPAH